MKLKKGIYRLKGYPIIVQILYGLLLVAVIITGCVFKLFVRLIFLLCANLSVFNESKIKPLISSLYEYIYHRACDAFDCRIEQEYEKYISEEKEIVIPLINRVREFILQVLRLILGIKKLVKRRKKKKILLGRKQYDQHKKGIISLYLARFQALFRVLEY